MSVSNPERGHAWIIDNRNGTTERTNALGISVAEANQMAYSGAADECVFRNEREGWQRFVAITFDAAYRLGFFRRTHSRVA